jgi:SAM-dependent methyltransferase
MDRLLEATRRAEEQHFWFRGFRAFVRPLVADALNGASSANILDCGCGTGANLVMLTEFGRAFGFDISWHGLQFARGYGQPRVAHASISNVPFATESFDLVTAFDVLYSLRDDQEAAALDEIFRVLRPGGTLIVNVAALNVLRGNHSVFGSEVRRSTRRRLRHVLDSHGFEVSRLTYTNFSLFPLMLAVRTAQRVIGLATPEEAGTDIMVPPKPVNAFLAFLLKLEARVLRVADMPVGSSLLCLARKPSTASTSPTPSPSRSR